MTRPGPRGGSLLDFCWSRTSTALVLLAAGACATARSRPDDAGARLLAAQQDLVAGRAAEAQREFEEVLSRDPRELAAIRGRIEAARRNGVLPLVTREAQDATVRRPGDALTFYALGLARFAAGDEAAAVAALRLASELKPDEADIQYRLGVALLDGEKFVDARGPLQRAVQLAPGVARYRTPLATCIGRLGDRKGAMDALRNFASLSPSADEAALAVKAARALTDPFRDLPQPARAELELALGYLVRDAPGLAVPPLESLLQKMPDLAPAHALLGLAQARLDEGGRAATELKRAAELAPDLPQAHAYLAELYAAKDRPELAAQEYAAALERDPLDPDTLRRLGILRLEHGGDAREPLTAAAALVPGDDGLQLLLARAEIAAGAAGPARARLERLSERRPEDAEVLFRLALLLYDERTRAGDPSRAELGGRVEKLLDKVLTLQPENAAASKLLSALKAS